MKQITTTKTILILAFLLTLVSSFSFAGTRHELNPQVRNAFYHDFRKATLVSSEAHDKFVSVTFSLDNKISIAYYSADGQLLAVVRNILSNELPDNLQASLKNNLNKYWVSELFEINGNDEPVYYVSLENADEKLNLRSTEDGEWQIFSRVAKD